MTGTALTSAEEFDKVYKLDVVSIPTNEPMARQDFPDKIFKTEEGKFKAIIREIKEIHEKGQPLLIGTGGVEIGEHNVGAIEKNMRIKAILDREGIACSVLNGRDTENEKEGQIIAQAGKRGAVTIATNMAGRGVDIVLGGNPPDLEMAKIVKELGGLHVISIERNGARRVDNQLRGRSGRQGDPGSTQFFVSLEDDLMRIFGGDKIKSLMTALKIPEDEPIQAGMISGAIESAQEKIEGFNFDARHHLLEYDDVLNKHREIIYKKRKEFLESNNLKEKILEIFQKVPKPQAEAGIPVAEGDLGTGFYGKEEYEKKEKEVGEQDMRQLEKIVCLRILDMLWQEHLSYMDHIRDSVRLRAYSGRDPLVEYKNEGHKAFGQLLTMLDANIAENILSAKGGPASGGKVRQQSQSVEPGKKEPGRNDPCPCGAKHPDGRPIKYKHCHGR